MKKRMKEWIPQRLSILFSSISPSPNGRMRKIGGKQRLIAD